ncbi:MAG: beta-hydroxyacyl-ACP dehydratase, partial [Nitratireductor sp.]|nr:beta-hydroxyacyl-ACP dehydratase [Nitratireductor sp.]
MLLEKFQMIDRITEVDLDAKKMSAFSIVPDDSPVFEGHFPGHPLVPGVLMIEIMAQCS